MDQGLLLAQNREYLFYIYHAFNYSKITDALRRKSIFISMVLSPQGGKNGSQSESHYTGKRFVYDQL